MREYRLTTESGKMMMYAADSPDSARRLAEEDGYQIVRVERSESGYWVMIWEKPLESR